MKPGTDREPAQKNGKSTEKELATAQMREGGRMSTGLGNRDFGATGSLKPVYSGTQKRRVRPQD